VAGKKGRSGRKPIEINYDELRKVCALHPTDEELASFLQCSVDTITNLKKNNPEFLVAYNEGKGTGKLSLRRRQWNSALGEVKRDAKGNAIEVLIPPNVTMQIWLGKQLLRQSDTPDLAVLDAQQDPVSTYAGIPWEMISPSFLGFIQAVRIHKYTHYWTKGGRGSTKSSAISLALVDGLIRNPDTHAVVMREVFATIKDSAYAQIEWAIEELGHTDNFIFKKSPLEITYKPTGQKILFRGLDNPQKLRSIKVKFGYIAWAWYEEASDIRGGMETIRNVNQSLMRSGDKFWAFYSYNPPKSKNNWVNVAADAMQSRADTLVHSSDLLSVPPEWLGEQFLIEAEALKEANPNAYEHEYLGIATGSGGDVFDNVVVEPISKETIAGLQMTRRGIDFGFATDPFAFALCGYNRLYDTLYIFDEIFQLKIHDDEAADAIRKKGVSKEPVYADSADPKGISNMQREGLNVLGCTKFPGSREHGYKFLQRWKKIVIDPARCPNAKREFVGCEYERDKDGNFLSVIPKANDHTIDGVRYALDAEMRNARAATWGNASTRA
jgi:PBSX family phage terminase large subunit